MLVFISNPYLIYFFTHKILLPTYYNLILIALITGNSLVSALIAPMPIISLQSLKIILAYRRKEEQLIKL